MRFFATKKNWKREKKVVQVLSWTILKEDEPYYYLESLESLELETDRETSTDRERPKQTETES